MISAQIDKDRIGAGLLQFCCDLARLAVGQSQHYDVVTGESLGSGLFQDTAGQGGDVRMVLAKPLSGAGISGHHANLGLRVGRQQPQDLAAGVARGPGHRHAESHSNSLPYDYATDCNFMQARRATIQLTESALACTDAKRVEVV
jgi:hypothetical protein